ncbi:hypothetical protein B0H19DRAFT_1378402 [Mycena capillaripes]|nr:hypothetical protein B0H19DRAFT_1378402 [Mycena capillaripes]
MGAFDAFFGTGLIGTWVGSFLFGVAFSQTFQYFNNFPNDGLLRKSLVASSLLFAFVALIGEYADVYLPTITFWGNPAALTTETWSVPVYTIFNSMVAVIANSYLISRFHVLQVEIISHHFSVSKNIVLTVVLCGLVLFVFVMAVLSVLLFPGVENFQKAETLALIWAISSAVTDVTIAASLIWTLRGMNSTFKNTNRMVRRIAIIAIQNGGATSLVAIAGMIAVIVKINSNIPACFYFLLGPLYVLTLLSNFNLRQSDVARSTVMTAPTVGDIELANRRREEGSADQKQDLNTESFSRAQITVPSFIDI